MTAPRDVIKINSTGSDTQASGLGPSTAVFGTTGTSNSGSAVVTGISTTGVQAGDLFWGNTSSGRQFSIIASVDSGTQVTLDDTLAANHAGNLTWAIGGKRATLGNTSSRLLFTNHKVDWVIQLENDETISSAITVSGGSLRIELRGLTGAVRAITQSANARHFSVTGVNLLLRNIKCANSNATKTSAQAVDFAGSAGSLIAIGCIFGDATNKLNSTVSNSSGLTAVTLLYDCTITDTTSIGIDSTSATSTLELHGCTVKNAGAAGIQFYTGSTTVRIHDCLVIDCTTDGIVMSAGGTDGHIRVWGCTVDGNGGDGFDVFVNALSSMELVNNIFSNNGGYGVNLSSTILASQIRIADYNVFYNNTSGARNNLSAGASDLTVNPNYVNAAGGDFTPQEATLEGAVLPAAFNDVGNFGWPGAVQPEDQGGGVIPVFLPRSRYR